MNAERSVCIIAQNAYGIISDDNSGHIGGAEIQTALLARWLASRGYRTSLITWADQKRSDEWIDNVRVLKMCARDAGIPGIRFLYPRLTSLYSAMKRADAEVYYHNSAEHVTGLASMWCRAHRRRFVYSVASDVACRRELPAMKKSYERFLYRYGLRSASKVITQTNRQKQLLADEFGIAAVRVPMPCAFSPEPDLGHSWRQRVRSVLWVGRVDRMKRLEMLLDVAERLPNVRFDVVAANLESALRDADLGEYAKGLHERAQKIANVAWRGSMSHRDLNRFYASSLCLCCTSTYEGFPNTFLEAWSYATPVISSFDPDQTIQSRGLGKFASSVESIAVAIGTLIGSEAVWEKYSDNCKVYFNEEHCKDVALPRFERELLETTEQMTGGFGGRFDQGTHHNPNIAINVNSSRLLD